MQKNVSSNERIVSSALGGLALLKAMTDGNSGRLLSPARLILGSLGAALLWRGGTGHCPIYSKFDVNSKNVLDKVEASRDGIASICINKSVSETRKFLVESDLNEFSFSENGQPDQVICNFQGKDWVLNYKDYGDGRRTLLTTCVEPTKTNAGKLLGVVMAGPIKGVATTILRNLKALCETGEIANNVGQARRDRSTFGQKIEGAVVAARS